MNRLDVLVDAWLDGTLSAADEGELADLLRDPVGRRAFRALVRWHGALHRELAARPSLRQPSVPARRRAAPRPWWLMVAAAGLALLVTGVVWWPAAVDSRPVLASGRPMDPGAVLDSATVAVVRWADGSSATVAAGARAALLADGLGMTLTSGRLHAEVRPQPADRPFRIVGSLAAVRVVGTAFAVAAVPGALTVSVERGSVVVEQEASALTVPAGGTALATAISPARLLAPGTRLLLPTDGDGWFGTPSATGLALAFDASQSTAARVDTWRIEPPRVPGGWLPIDPAVGVEIDATLARPGRLSVVLQSFSADGRTWLGNQQYDAADLPAGPLRWRLRLRDFHWQSGYDLDRLTGRPLSRLTLVTWGSDPGVVLHHLALEPAPATTKP